MAKCGITKLTKKQRDLLTVYRNRGIAEALCPVLFDMATAERYAEKLMKFLDRPCRGVTVVDDVPSGVDAVAKVFMEQAPTDDGSFVLYKEAHDTVFNAMWARAYEPIMDEVICATTDSVIYTVRSKVELAVTDIVCRGSIHSSTAVDFLGTGKPVTPFLEGQWESGYKAAHEYFTEVLKLDLPDASIITDQVQFGGVWPLNCHVVICKKQIATYDRAC